MADFLLSWLLVPALLCVLSLGCGLLGAWAAERPGAPRGEPFPGVLILPIGFAAVVVIASLVTTWKATAPLAGVAPLAGAVAGLVVGRRRGVGRSRTTLAPSPRPGLSAAVAVAPGGGAGGLPRK